jgi:hypothetical protein
MPWRAGGWGRGGADDVKVKLVVPTASHVLGGQIYTPSIREEGMVQSRPQRGMIQTIIPHVMNILRKGGHLNTTVNDSMKQVGNCLELMNEVFNHMALRRARETDTAVRIELFLVYNNEEEPICGLPYYDPTNCVDMFNKDLIDNFENEMVTTHLDPINKNFQDVGRLYTVFEREREVRVRCVWVEVRGLEI